MCEKLARTPTARPLQTLALRHGALLTSRRNLIVSAPTNTGKTLLGSLVLLDAIRAGGRALLLEPLRALARERADDYREVMPEVAPHLGREIVIRLTTGDVRLDGEELSAPPPKEGQLVIATPERLDVILRNPAWDAWVQSIRAVCVDEAHMLADRARGPTLEHVLTSLLVRPTPPRMALLSATMGSLDMVRAWLDPCDDIVTEERGSPLSRTVIALENDEDPRSIVGTLVREALHSADASVLVFVYQTASAAKLARDLTADLGALAGDDGALHYHSQMSAANREAVRAAFTSGRSRVVVSTTALAMGVNLPASHVIIRDVTFHGEGALGTVDLLQMMGRAGRGSRPGAAFVLVRHSDALNPEQLAAELRAANVPPLRSAFSLPERDGRGAEGEAEPPAARLVSALLARRPDDGMTEDELRTFLGRSLGGPHLVGALSPAIAWMRGTEVQLTWVTDLERIRLTPLGLAATRAALPASVAAGIGRFLRDLLSLEQADALLRSWKPLDHLVLLELLWHRPPSLRPYREDLDGAIDVWMEQHSSDVPMLFREFLRGRPGHSRASEVLGSLGIRTRPARGIDAAEAARRYAYSATLRAVLLLERSRGAQVSELERRFQLTPGKFEGLEERWRDTVLWLLSGLAAVCDVRCFGHHLRTECLAPPPRIARVREQLKALRGQAYDLLSDLQYCSPLGVLLRPSSRAGRRGVGVKTIRLLEANGVQSVAALARLSEQQLVALGVRPVAARALRQRLRQP